MNFIQFLVFLHLTMNVFSSNPTYWIQKSAGRAIVTTPQYDLSSIEAEEVMNCNIHRIWECALDSDLNPPQQLCKRLATNQPNDSEKDRNGENRFSSLRDLWIQTTGAETYVPATTCYVPTDAEKQQVEDCYFSRSWRQKELSKRTARDSFCIELAEERPSATNETTLQRLVSYRKVWANMPEVGRLDFTQILECSALKTYYGPYPELMSHNCFQYYEQLKKPKTWRDLRRKKMHDCLDQVSQSGQLKHYCMCIIHAYKQLYYVDNDE